MLRTGAAPLAYGNWRSGALSVLLGPNPPHVFFVTSESSSAQVWKQWLAGLQSVQSTFVIPSVLLVHDSDSSNWTHRISSDGRVQVNLRRFQALHSTEKVEAVFTQLVQSWHCARLMKLSEVRLGRRYTRVARVRTDLVVGVRLWPTRHHQCVTPAAGTHRIFSNGSKCATMLHDKATTTAIARAEDRILNGCLKAAAAANPIDWFIYSEFFAIGARDVMVERALVALDFIDSIPAPTRTPTRHRLGNPLEVAHAVADWLLNSSSSTSPTTWCPVRKGNQYRLIFARPDVCAHALGDFDLIRAFGPPVMSYYFQESEWQCYAVDCPSHACFSKRECPKSDCDGFMHRRWRLRHGFHRPEDNSPTLFRWGNVSLRHGDKMETVAVVARVGGPLIGDQFGKRSEARDYDGFRD